MCYAPALLKNVNIILNFASLFYTGSIGSFIPSRSYDYPWQEWIQRGGHGYVNVPRLRQSSFADIQVLTDAANIIIVIFINE